MLIQNEVNSKCQLREKITLHWLEHFAVGSAKVVDESDPSGSTMQHYINTVRAESLGNFTKLMIDVSKEPAMLYWLDSANNNGTMANATPNQNFARELMRLYTIGPTKLNADGTPVLDSTGAPVPTYTETDVGNLSYALSGFTMTANVGSSLPDPVNVSNFTVAFNPTWHPAATTYTIIGQPINDTGGQQCPWPSGTPCIYDTVITMLASQPTTWAYESKEMIERLANENPSPAYVARITKVWGSNLNASDQIAKVVMAIATDPEFPLGINTMPKEPIEFFIDAARAFAWSR